MKSRRVLASLAAAGVTVATLITVAPGPAGASSQSSGLLTGVQSLISGLTSFGCMNPANHLSPRNLLPALIPSSTKGFTCFGEAVAHAGQRGPAVSSTPTGNGPTQIRAAYGLTGLHGNGRTVAIIDAYDNPKAESDLATYRATYGLPACTTANGCFHKVNQAGQAAPLPATDYGWAQEISLDLDAVSSTCPDCHILLVEANTPDTAPLMTAVDTAVRLGAVAVSQSYGSDEDKTILAADKHLFHPGVAITASSGDNGYGVQWPASSQYVTAVGGTTLTSTARGWTQTAWAGSGSGCSKFEPKPAWQHDTGCAKRTVADVAAVADPASGLAVYDTYNSCAVALLCGTLLSVGMAQGSNGWIQVGGTSLAAPIIAGIYALAGRRVTSGSYPYGHTGALTDVTVGSDGSCGGSYLCTAKRGYDGPTGLGTPRGTGAF
ncbi:MAG: S8 family serine peptidase [Jatrophihabitantaceae bacterium]